MINELTIQKVKDSAGIVDIISDFYELKKKGQSWTCLCPFHDDHHLGSFFISEKKNIYKCFSCGAQGGPVDFLMQHEKLQFKDAIAWLGKKYGIEVEGADKFKVRKAVPKPPTPQLPTLYLDADKFVKPRLDRDNNVLVKWLRSLPWNEEQSKRLEVTLKNYFVGSAKDGKTIFWQADEQGRFRTGKMMQYMPNGHRDKGKWSTTWVHSRLFSAGVYDFNEWEIEPTLFGMHLLDFAKPDTVNIVESEKTAIICATAYGNMAKQTWMATGGMSALTKDKLRPLIERGVHIVLYPDHDGIEKWKEVAETIGYEHLSVNVDFMKQHWRREDGAKADIADVVIRMMTPTLDKICAEDPVVKYLVDTFNLELINTNKYDERRDE